MEWAGEKEKGSEKEKQTDREKERATDTIPHKWTENKKAWI